MLWFDQWVDGKRNETIWGKPDEPPAKGQVRLPKYGNLSQIFERYDDTWAMTKFTSTMSTLPDIEIDMVMQEAFGDDVLF